MAHDYYRQGVDELTFLCITQYRQCALNDLPILKLLNAVSRNVFVPLCVGGGIRDMQIVGADGHAVRTVTALEIADLYFGSGADKVSIGSDAVYAAEKWWHCA